MQAEQHERAGDSVSVKTSLGTLHASVVGADGDYPGISVVLVKDDGSTGFVSLTEVKECDALPGEKPVLQTNAYDGVNEEPVAVECDPDGMWMSEFESVEADPFSEAVLAAENAAHEQGERPPWRVEGFEH